MALAGVPTLFIKELRQHGLPMLLLASGFFATLMLAHVQNQEADFSMSPLEVLLLSITLILPLITFIMGNRLVATEYLGNTRQFVEALPIKPSAFLLVKYSLGLVYLLALALLSVGYAWLLSDSGNALDSRLLNIVLVKTLCVVFMYWGVAFCFSFFGYLRYILYIMLAMAVIAMLMFPQIDVRDFGPFALLDQSVFAFERNEMPVKAAIQTLAIGLGFTLLGFVLPLLRDGSFVEALAKPISRSNLVVLVVFGFGLTVTMSALIERWDVPSFEFSSDYVLSEVDPTVSVLYLEPQYKARSQRLLTALQDQLRSLQQALGYDKLPTLRIALDVELSETDLNDFRYSMADGVLISANFSKYDSYSMAVLQTHSLHQLMDFASGNRRIFEPYHWLLDGFSRWWVEGNTNIEEHKTELYARAIQSLDYLEQPIDLSGNWQWIADKVGYPSAEALAFTAMEYVEQQYGRDAVIELGKLLKPTVGNHFVGMLKDRSVGIHRPILNITGQELDQFFIEWQQWLVQQTSPELVTLLAKMPTVYGVVDTVAEGAGSQQLIGYYQNSDGSSLAANSGFDLHTCDMQHTLITPFDSEMAPEFLDHDEQPCTGENPAHSVSSFYASGDRVYVAFELGVKELHQTLRVGAYRMVIE